MNRFMTLGENRGLLRKKFYQNSVNQR